MKRAVLFVLKTVLYVVLAGVAVLLVLVPLYAVVAPPFSTPMLADRLHGRSYARQWVTLEDVSQVLVRSVIVSEDARFCRHSGIDWVEFGKVIKRIDDDDRPRGASTITMQLAKNLFLWQSRSYVRKALELPIALYMDLVLSKRRILELYLNSVEWGPGVYGIGAAAERHFGVRPSRLGPDASARLAVVLPLPRLRDPGELSPRLRRLARLVRQRARRAGRLTDCIYKG